MAPTYIPKIQKRTNILFLGHLESLNMTQSAYEPYDMVHEVFRFHAEMLYINGHSKFEHTLIIFDIVS